MPRTLVECVPNFSEARRPEVVEAILQAIAADPLIHVLDKHSDIDHNRTVITFVGPPEGVEQAAFRGIARAAQLIDLNKHKGEHPRIGATDVVPFVPISGVSMQDCIDMARRVSQRVADELHIPVYLYEQAAVRSERQNLENIRRGEYEGLKSEIASDPQREPDFGPKHLGPAGATAIGARPFLIAFNVYLTSTDVAVAKKIAQAIRHSSGGLRYVKALGLLVDGRAQVSMNLTDFRQTPIARVVEMVRREAQRYGVAIHHSELVGLIPQAALEDAATWYLQLDQFDVHQVLERRLEEVYERQTPAQRPLGVEFLDALAKGTPTPGGGSAAAYCAAAASALVAMVARLTVGKKAYAALDEKMESILERAENQRAFLTQAVTEDAAAFEAVMAAMRMPKGDPEEKSRRTDALENATLEAARVPLEVAQHSVEVLELAQEVVEYGNLNAISDGATAGALAFAALTSAGYNVRINASSLRNRTMAGELVENINALEAAAAEKNRRIRAILSERGGLAQA